ncbi:MAG TPA: SH3 domain-containing protein [Chloroflexota bacterium]|nr:SH3 domain-containing protein [Chloroflexota bacterium]
MEEENTSTQTQETVETSVVEPTPDGPQNSGKSSKFIIIGFVVVAVLVLIGLFLPPISLGERLGLTGGESTATAVANDPTAAPSPTDTAVVSSPTIPGEFEVMAGDTPVTVAAVSPAGMAAAGLGALPTHVVALGSLYTISSEGAPTGQVAVTLPAGTDVRAADLYGWDGAAWHFVASDVDTTGGHVVSKPGALYKAYGLAQPGAPAAYTFAAELTPAGELAPELLPPFTVLSLGTLRLVGNGDLQGEIAAAPDGDFAKYLHVTNSGEVVDAASLSAFLGNSPAQGNQINVLVNTAVANGFNGVNLDYQGVDPSQREAFTSFVGSLADALRAQGLKLALTLGTPRDVAGAWDTGGHDWAALSALADTVLVQMPLDPQAYSANGLAQQLLDYAVRNVDRAKLLMLVSAHAVSRLGESLVEIPNDVALSNFGSFDQEEGLEVEPGTAVDVALTGSAGPLEWDGLSQTYRFSYEGPADQTYHVWLSNPAALGQRLEIGDTYNLLGAALRGLDTVAAPAAYAAALAALGPDAPPQTEGAAIVWTVKDENESILASESGSALSFAWAGSEAPGVYSITVDFALGETIIPLDNLIVTIAEPVVEEEEEEEVVVEATPTAAPAAAVAVSYDPGNADAVVKLLANVRTGPGLQYGTLPGGAAAGTLVNIIGRNAESNWFQVVLPDDREGWMFTQVLELNTALDVNGLPVVEVAAAPPGSAPPPVAGPPVAAGGFELGGQTHTFANPQLMSSAGMNWVKFQHKWGPGGNPGDLAGRINNAHASGFKVLLSIPGANTYPTSIEFASYVEFLRGVAALGPDAIEVWNEQNIDFEWPAGQIDPASYVNNMLAPAYNAIKSANPNVMVISGAPAPTGFDNGTNAWSDARYMAGMAAAGGGNYADCIGAHFNAGATAPSQNTGHPTGSDHYSWYLIPTLNVYSQLGKPVCFTELGYLSGEDYGGVPSRFSWAANTTVAQHASWLAQAVSTAANTGRVRMVIVFNVDFTQWGDDPQAGYAMIRRDGSCPACSTLAQVMGR